MTLPDLQRLFWLVLLLSSGFLLLLLASLLVLAPHTGTVAVLVPGTIVGVVLAAHALTGWRAHRQQRVTRIWLISGASIVGCVLSGLMIADYWQLGLLLLLPVPLQVGVAEHPRYVPLFIVLCLASAAVIIIDSFFDAGPHVLRLAQFPAALPWISVLLAGYISGLLVLLWRFRLRPGAPAPIRLELATQQTLVFTTLSAVSIVIVTGVLAIQIYNARLSEVGQNFQTLAQINIERVDHTLQQQVNALLALGMRDAEIQKGLTAANNRYPQDATARRQFMQAREQQWQAAGADIPPAAHIGDNQQAVSLNTFRNTEIQHNNMMLTDVQGGLVATQGTLPEQLFFTSTDWWQTAWNDGQGGVYLGDLTTDPETGQMHILIAVGVVEAETDRAIGVLASTYNLRSIQQHIQTVNTHIEGDVYLIDSSGLILAGPDETDAELSFWTGTSPVRHSGSAPAQPPIFMSNWQLGFDQQGNQSVLASAPLNAPGTHHLSPLQNLQWATVVSETRMYALSYVSQSTKIAGLVGMLATALVVGVATWLARITTHPIENLTARATAISQGDLTQRVVPSGTVEMVALSETFNALTDRLHTLINTLQSTVEQRTAQLQTRVRELQELNLLLQSEEEALQQSQRQLRESEARYQALAAQNAHLYEMEHQRVQELDALRATLTELSGELELDRLLNSILQRAVELLHAHDGQLSLYDPERGDLHTLICYNMEIDFTGNRQQLGEGATGYVAQTRQPLIINDYLAWQNRLKEYEPLGPKAIVLAPLLAGEHLIGVIGIGRVDPVTGFDTTDMKLLNLFAQQATVAIRNARLFAEVQQLATTDPLTGLYNRRHFFDLAWHEFERTQRYQHPLSIIMLDIDGFKQINDRYGHSAGDQVLRMVAQQCQVLTRTVDKVGRYGGEEMVIMLPETDLGRASTLAERLRDTLAQTAIPIEGHVLCVTASLGIATCSGQGDTNLEQLIDQADQAMYVAKQMGKNRVITWEDSLTHVRRVISSEQADQQLRTRHAALLAQAATSLNAHLEPGRVLENACEEIARVLHVPVVLIECLDQEQCVLVPAASVGLAAEHKARLTVQPCTAYDDLLSQAQGMLIVPDVGMSEQFPSAALYRAANVRTCITLPLLYTGDLVGMLTVATVADIRAFTEYELELLRRLAEQTATALTNARLFTELLHAYDDTLKGWSHAVDVWSRDSNTHSQRVCELTVRLAQHMDVTPDDLTHVQWGALLHDIGMIGVPDHIIRKTGVLTSEERSIVRQHPTYAYQALSNIPFLRPVLDIPYYHHERWDGSGYPLGLKGTEIPLTARLFAVVDVWDTLHSERPYRPAWPEEQVVIYLRQQAGRQFDPDVVDAFLHLLHQEHEQLMEW